MVIEGLELVLAPQKLFWVLRIVLPLGGTENSWETHPPKDMPLQDVYIVKVGTISVKFSV